MRRFALNLTVPISPKGTHRNAVTARQPWLHASCFFLPIHERHAQLLSLKASMDCLQMAGKKKGLGRESCHPRGRSTSIPVVNFILNVLKQVPAGQQ